MKRIFALGLLAVVAYAQNTNTVTIIPDGGDNVGKLRFLEKRANGSNYVALTGIDSVSFNKTITLPNLNGRVIVEEADNVTRVTGLEAAKLGFTGGFVRTQKLDLIDVAGGSGIWDWQAAGNMAGNASSWFRDPLGQDVLRFTRAVSGTLVSDATFSVHLYPKTNVTYDIGANSFRWRKLWVQDIDASGIITGAICSDCVHKFGTGGTPGGELIYSSDSAGPKQFGDQTGDSGVHVDFLAQNAASDQKWWRLAATTTGTFELQTANDANNAFNYIFKSTRSGTTPSLFTLNSTFLPGGTAFNIGDPTTLWEGGYFRHVDAHKLGTTGGYVATQKVDLVDVTGGSGIWDIQATGTMTGNAALWIRDPLGNDVIRFQRAVIGTATDYASVYVDLLPDANLSQKLGASSARWSEIWARDINISGTCTGCGGTTIANYLSSNPVQVVFQQQVMTQHPTDATFDWYVTGRPADEKRWRLIADGAGVLHLDALNDAYSAGYAAFAIYRSGVAVTKMAFNEQLIPGTDLAYNFGDPAYRWSSVYAAQYEGHSSQPFIIKTGGFAYLPAETDHVAYYKKAGAHSFYWRKSNTGYPSSPGEVDLMQLTDGGTLSVNGSIQPYTNSTFDIGNTGGRWNVVYTTHLDAAPVGTIGNYIRTRKYEMVDSSGGSGAWDVITNANAAGTNSNMTIRDNGANTVVNMISKISGVTLNRTQWGHILTPDTDGARGLGLSSLRWGPSYFTSVETGNLNITGTCTGCGGFNTASSYTLTGNWTFTSQVNLGAASITTLNSGARVNGTITSSFDSTYNVGTSTTVYNTVYAKNINAGVFGVNNISMQANNVDFSGTIQVAGSAIKRSGVTLTLGEAFVPVTGVYSNQYYAGSTAGTTNNLSCGAGLAIKAINVSGGIVIGVSCGAP